jgi:hypothetical protein
MNINRLSSLCKENINIIYNTKFFYFNKNNCLIPWYNIFNYYFFIINDKLFINDIEFTHIFDYFDNTPNKQNILNEKKVYDYNNFQKIILNKCILFSNNYSNVGHSFFNILNHIYSFYKLENKNEYEIVICDDLFNYNKFLISIIYLFFDKSQIIVLQEKTIVEANELLYIKDFSSKINNDSVDFLINTLKQKIKKHEIPIYENIFLCKTTDTQNINPDNKCFDNSYKIFFEKKNFKVIKAEEYSIEDLFTIIYHSKKIILSWGCCSYLNSIFVNTNTSFTLVLCHKGYKNEYESVMDYSIKNTSSDELFIKSGWFPIYKNEEDKKNIKYILDLEDTISQENSELIEHYLNLNT